ncbi:hypothetical protein BC826DRAFT_967533 [Russula brevipes]|nr:hypothetical protein BC826DRAFT_967533 [Russula brevipes]
MSSPVRGDDEQLALDHFFRCFSGFSLSWVYHVLIGFLSQEITALLNAVSIRQLALRLGSDKWGRVPAIVGVAYALNIPATFVTPSVSLVLKDGTVMRCDVLTGAIKRFLVIPYVSIMAIEAVVVALTLFKIFQYYKDVPGRTRKLLDVLWIDGLVFMPLDTSRFEQVTCSCWYSERRIGASYLLLLTPYLKLEEFESGRWMPRHIVDAHCTAHHHGVEAGHFRFASYSSAGSGIEQNGICKRYD